LNQDIVNKKGARGEIYAYGLRNPWSFSFDSKTGDLICADVGQNKEEEVDLIVKGGNYGWRVREGKNAFKGKEDDGSKYIEPLAVYSRKQGVSITGGYVYRGNKIPALQGCYIYCDFAFNNFWLLKQENGKVSMNTLLGKYNFGVSSFGVDAEGEIYICSFSKGAIYKIVGVEK